MPLVRTYACTTCAQRTTVHDGQPVPHHCGAPMKWRQTRDYKPEEHGWDTGMRSAAIGFRNTSPWMMPLGGGSDGHQEVAVESLHQLRQLERRSEQAARNGEGQEFRARAFSQDRSNMLDNTFGAPPHAPKPQLYDNQGRQKISFTPVAGEDADCAMGPGADEAQASSLGDAGL